MTELIEKPLDHLIDNLIPNYIAEEYPQYVAFVKKYLQLLEEPTAPWTVLNNITNFIDISLAPESSLTNFVEQYISSFPTENLATVDIREFITNAKTFYSEKGNEAALKFIFNLTGGTLDVYYPSSQIFELNESKLCGIDKIHDNYYYAYYVYEIRSDLDAVDYEEIVRAMAHPVGEKIFFKRVISMTSDAVASEVIFGMEVLDTLFGIVSNMNGVIFPADVLVADVKYNIKMNASTKIISSVSDIIGNYFFSETGNDINFYKDWTFKDFTISEAPPVEIFITRWVQYSEPVTVTEEIPIEVDLGTTDDASGDDAVPIGVEIAESDTGSASENVPTPPVGITVIDTGDGSETDSVESDIPVSDDGSGADTDSVGKA